MWLGNKRGGLGRRGREKRLESRGGWGRRKSKRWENSNRGHTRFFPSK